MNDNPIPLTIQFNTETAKLLQGNPHFARAVSLVMTSQNLVDSAAFKRAIILLIERPRRGLLARIARLFYRLTNKQCFYRWGYWTVEELQ